MPGAPKFADAVFGDKGGEPPDPMDAEATEGGDEKKAEGEKGRMLSAAIKKGDGEAIYEAVRAIME